MVYIQAMYNSWISSNVDTSREIKSSHIANSDLMNLYIYCDIDPPHILVP